MSHYFLQKQTHFGDTSLYVLMFEYPLPRSQYVSVESTNFGATLYLVTSCYYLNFLSRIIILKLVVQHKTIFVMVTETSSIEHGVNTLLNVVKMLKLFGSYDFVHMLVTCGQNTYQIMF